MQVSFLGQSFTGPRLFGEPGQCLSSWGKPLCLNLDFHLNIQGEEWVDPSSVPGLVSVAFFLP